MFYPPYREPESEPDLMTVTLRVLPSVNGDMQRAITSAKVLLEECSTEKKRLAALKEEMRKLEERIDMALHVLRVNGDDLVRLSLAAVLEAMRKGHPRNGKVIDALGSWSAQQVFGSALADAFEARLTKLGLKEKPK